MEDFDSIINDYLEPFPVITKNDIHNLMKVENSKNFKIINNKLYIHKNDVDKCCLKNGYGPRIDSFKYMMLKTLDKYKINDVEFAMFDDDSINDNNVELYKNNNKILPIICSTSVLDSLNVILCPDFTFTFCLDFCNRNNPKIFSDICNLQEQYKFSDKINKMVYRGSLNNYYRGGYYFKDTNIYDIKHVANKKKTDGFMGDVCLDSDYLSYVDKSKYKYFLHLNGHEGVSNNGAYSSAFKYGLMSNSVVFYSAPVIYREFWYHKKIFREGEHFVYTRSPDQLDNTYKYLIQNEMVSENIAQNAFQFAKKYLLDYDNIMYYMQKLLNEYSKRQDFIPELNNDDVFIEGVLFNKDIDYF